MRGNFTRVAAMVMAVVLGVALASCAEQASGAAASGAPSYKLDSANGTVVNVNLTAFETVQEIAPGVTYHVWTFDGTAPGPVIRVHLGDTVHFTLTTRARSACSTRSTSTRR